MAEVKSKIKKAESEVEELKRDPNRLPEYLAQLNRLNGLQTKENLLLQSRGNNIAISFWCSFDCLIDV